MSEELNDNQKGLQDDSSTSVGEDEEKVRLQKELEEKDKAISNVVEEIKVLRKENQELKAQTTQANTDPNDVAAQVAKALAEEKRKAAEANREKALKSFQSENKEFHQDNDPGGLKMSLLERELSGFRTDGLSTVEDFVNLFNKAKRLMVENTASNEERIQPQADIPNSSASPKSNSPTKLEPKELQLIKNLGWTEERYLSVKAKQPDYVRSLLKDY